MCYHVGTKDALPPLSDRAGPSFLGSSASKIVVGGMRRQSPARGFVIFGHEFRALACFTDAQSPLHLLRASTGGGGVEVGLDVSDVEDVVHPCI